MMQTGYNESHVQRLQAVAAARLHNFHGPKRQLLGKKAIPAPAWKANVRNGASITREAAEELKGKEAGSKILLSKLPLDVTPAEVEELFKKTVGPLKDFFLVYNNQGNSKGMAIVTFAKPGDAVLARQKYDGKIVDGRRRIKIEMIYDDIPSPVEQPSLTLLNRLGGKVFDGSSPAFSAATVPSAPALTLQQRTQVPSTPAAPIRRVRFKKGPKRPSKRYINGISPAIGSQAKRGSVSKDDLDKDMEDYRAAASGSGSTT